jgi:hypothetical protein
MVHEAITTARAAGATGEILVRGDSAYGTSAVVGACVQAEVWFSVVLAKHRTVNRAIGAIGEHAWTPVHYPGAVVDPDTGQLISDAEVAEVSFTAFAATKHPVTARLIVRRVRDRARGDELFPIWRYHPFFTNSTEPTVTADLTHRRHAIIETVFADLIDGPLAHLPSGRFAANSAWAICAAITHNLLRAAGTLTGPKHALARDATLRRQIVTIPARLPARNAATSCTYRRTGPGPSSGPRYGTTCSPPQLGHRSPRDHRPPAAQARPETPGGKAGKTSGSDLPALQENRPIQTKITKTAVPRIEAKLARRPPTADELARERLRRGRGPRRSLGPDEITTLMELPTALVGPPVLMSSSRRARRTPSGRTPRAGARRGFGPGSASLIIPTTRRFSITGCRLVRCSSICRSTSPRSAAAFTACPGLGPRPAPGWGHGLRQCFSRRCRGR